MVPTASWGYLRLRSEAYDGPQLQAWADRIPGEAYESCHANLARAILRNSILGTRRSVAKTGIFTADPRNIKILKVTAHILP